MGRDDSEQVVLVCSTGLCESLNLIFHCKAKCLKFFVQFARAFAVDPYVGYDFLDIANALSEIVPVIGVMPQFWGTNNFLSLSCLSGRYRFFLRFSHYRNYTGEEIPIAAGKARES